MNLKLLKQLILILIGTLIVGFAVINFSIRYNLADGGFSGINLIIYQMIGIDPWISNIVLNTPFIVILYKMFDLKTTLMTIYGVGTLTAGLAFWNIIGPVLPDWSDDMFIVVILYGVLFGSGIGLVIKAGGTTGGSVLIAKILYKKWGLSISQTLFLFDLTVISVSLLTFLVLTNAVYTLVGIFICTIVIAKVQEGGLFGYKCMIISDHFEKISKTVMKDLNRGATFLYGTGAHSGHDKRVLMVVIQKRELSQLKSIIHEIDPSSFVAVSHTYETLGEGFTYDSKSA